MHPSVRIIVLLIFAIVAYGVHGMALCFTLIVMLAGLLCLDLLKPYPENFKSAKLTDVGYMDGRFLGLTEFLKLLKRVRYILLCLLIVYAFNTPGEYLPGWYFSVTPTYEGIAAGAEQALRLSLVLAGVAMLLVTTSRDQLVAGLYYLALPLRLFGLDHERFAVRLWLTLYYVEHGTRFRHQNPLHQLLHLEELLDIDHSAPETIVLMKPEVRWTDVLTLIGLSLVGAYFICA
jgi:energy-coupling factor transporter transmembrane protein EcfT